MLLCYVTDRDSISGHASSRAGATDDLLRCIERAVACGIDCVQIREKDLRARELMELTRSAISIAQDKSNTDPRVAMPSVTRIIVNDRLDVALAADAGGVHLGGDSIPVANVVQWLRAGNAPSDFLIGASCHDVRNAMEAEGEGVNYIFFGPIFDTPSKARFGPPQGIEKLAEVCRSVRIPVVAIGGIHTGNAGACVRAGATGIAAIRLFQRASTAEELGEIVSNLRAIG